MSEEENEKISLDIASPSAQLQVNSLMQLAASAFHYGNYQAAERHLNNIIIRAPGHADAHYMLGILAGRKGRLDLAVREIDRAVKANPGNVKYLSSLSLALQMNGQLDRALAVYLRIIELNPADAAALNNLSVIYCDKGKFVKALDCCNKALQIRPDYASAHYNRGNALRDSGCFQQAVESYRKAIEYDSENAAAYLNCANVLWNSGSQDVAEAYARTSVLLQPGNYKAHSNLLFLLAARGQLTHQEMLAEQITWDEKHGREGHSNKLSDGDITISGNRRLKVGYLSPEFRTHAVSSFFEPLLSKHNCDSFEVYCYATHDAALSDETTERLRDMVEHWRFVANKNDSDLAHVIHDDGIDVLVDLSGHTGKNRLGVFTYKPAPVQVTYLGGFAATGLDAIDYWMTDAVLHPEDSMEQSVETKVRLPRCWLSYKPPVSAPEVADCPSSDENVVFGSFSNLSKIVPDVINTWAQILEELPGSRLLVMDVPLKDPATRKQIIEKFEYYGVSGSRLILVDGASYHEYLNTYSRVDIVLDPFPRTGGTTTAEAIWMGVPVITLVGDRYAGRISASQLVAIGLDEFITYTIDEYVRKAVTLARDVERRVLLRRNLRECMKNSEFCDGVSLARAVENAFLDMCGMSSSRHG